MTSDAPGWDAIDARLETFYPGVEPLHFGTLIKFALGGPDPLDGVSFYPREEHWHLVGYGMSDLYARDDDAEPTAESGWGFEFTFRVARAAGETEPPMWAANLLQNLARYVFSSGNWFEPGHHMNANGPLRQDHETDLTALAFAEDPELGAIDTPHGRLQFLQVVGLTTDEYAAVLHWNSQGLLDLLRDRSPLLVTDLDRPSITDDPRARAAIEAGQRRDGSSTSVLMVAGCSWSAEDDRIRLRFQEITTPMLARAIPSRLPHGRPMLLEGDDGQRILLNPAEVFAVRRPGDGVLELDLPPEAAAALPAALTPGSRPLPGADGVIIEV
ncbi:suppressor of fused domain protein [Actinoplanes flavus]|uniref:Suppressor of fused domain protein n=1 Tax=Actinoplanes flavus TaxID=2820290 RepID=A0ABS3UYZ7_9ACTN|nr:suppressor of fused domain protein [Actinoplanes flavus]MBO3743786.1 suppressor of fused domain protein [Actinoplanes flavus]